MSNITYAKLGNIGKVSMCKRVLKEQTNQEGGIPFYKISTFGNKADCFIARGLFEKLKKQFSYPKRGDVLISAAGTIGRTVVYNGEEAYFQDSNIVWIDNDETQVTNDYLYYFYQLKPWKKTPGSTIDRLYNNNIRDTDIFFPTDIEEQKKITNILYTLDEAISNNHRTNEELDSMINTIFSFWFLQYEFPDKNGHPYKSSGGAMVWNEVLNREIPKDWKVEELGEHLTSSRGISYNSGNLEGDGIPMINLASFGTNGTYKDEGIKNYSGEYPQEKTLKPYDLVMCNTQQTAIDFDKDIIGKAFLVPDIFDGDIVHSHHVTKIVVKNDDYKYYLCRLFDTKFFHKYIAGFTNGTNILGLDFSGVETYKTEIPDSGLLEKFAELSLDIEKKKSEIIKENKELASLRDFLLPLLMNGQVTFKD